MVSLIECVPNVSEGRRETVIAALAASMRVPDVSLLDVSSDVAHNRTVFTLAGTPGAVQQAVFALVAAALPVINLRHHEGVHPRMGAVDVVPFVPLAGVTMEECAALANDTARDLSRRQDLPTYLYGFAAATPGRRQLADLRRGGLERFLARMATPAWAPDFGPSTPHPSAGVTAVGARPVLIAYNVELATDKIDVARAVAAAVRERDGGLTGVKALGLALPGRGIVQVSMNLVDYRRTSVREAFEAVTREAAQYGVKATASEIVGLAPRAAVSPDDAWRVRLRKGARTAILEDRLHDAGVRL
jgi:glutamate formiminotransferase